MSHWENKVVLVTGGSAGLGRAIASQFADVVAVCDVDRQHAERGQKDLSDGKADIYRESSIWMRLKPRQIRNVSHCNSNASPSDESDLPQTLARRLRPSRPARGP